MDHEMGIIDQTPNQTQNYYLKKTLQFLVPISIISFLLSYFSLLPLIFHNLQFYSSFYPFLDRKCMFLVCNGILAFLANNLGLTKSFNGDGSDQIPEMLAAVPEENEIPLQQHQDDGGVSDEAMDITHEMVVSTAAATLESEEWGKDEDEDYDDDEDEESLGVEDILTPCVNEMRVSTEEMNKKFDEFIRRMKEEIRIEAREQYMIAV